MKHEKYPSIHLISSTYQRSVILIKEFAEKKRHGFCITYWGVHT